MQLFGIGKKRDNKKEQLDPSLEAILMNLKIDLGNMTKEILIILNKDLPGNKQFIYEDGNVVLKEVCSWYLKYNYIESPKIVIELFWNGRAITGDVVSFSGRYNKKDLRKVKDHFLAELRKRLKKNL